MEWMKSKHQRNKSKCWMVLCYPNVIEQSLNGKREKRNARERCAKWIRVIQYFAYYLLLASTSLSLINWQYYYWIFFSWLMDVMDFWDYQKIYTLCVLSTQDWKFLQLNCGCQLWNFSDVMMLSSLLLIIVIIFGSYRHNIKCIWQKWKLLEQGCP